MAAFLALTAYRPGPGAAIYLGTAGLVLVVSVIEASYLLAYQDGLTQLPTRRALTEAMQRLGGSTRSQWRTWIISSGSTTSTDTTSAITY